MHKFFQKHAGIIIIILLSSIAGGSTTQIINKLVPDATDISKELLRSIMIEIIQDEIGPIKDDIKEIKDQYSVLVDGSYEEWERVIRKQYLKVQTDRDDLSWSDVEYALSKWPLLPDKWQTPELCAMIEYLNIKYEEHINNGV